MCKHLETSLKFLWGVHYCTLGYKFKKQDNSGEVGNSENSSKTCLRFWIGQHSQIFILEREKWYGTMKLGVH